MNPPVTQVMCEFRFEPQAEWDQTLPGLIYSELQHVYKKRRQVHAIETGTTNLNGITQQRVGILERTRFLTDDEVRFVQVSPNYLSITHLKPYRTWNEFLPMIEQALKAYIDIANPKIFQRIGLRYVNQIQFETATINLEDYFDFYPFLGVHLPQNHVSFMSGAHFQYHDGRDLLRLQIMSGLQEKPNGVPVTLDLEYFLGRPMPIIIDTTLEWFKDAHKTIEGAFEGCIKDSLREMFVKGESN
jgi:uncharacterized protein (TIGR04255 family)